MTEQMTDNRRVVLEAITSVAPDTDPASIDADEDLWYALDLDSMDQLGVMVAIGKRLGVEIPEAAYPDLISIDDLVAYLDRTA